MGADNNEVSPRDLLKLFSRVSELGKRVADLEEAVKDQDTRQATVVNNCCNCNSSFEQTNTIRQLQSLAFEFQDLVNNL